MALVSYKLGDCQGCGGVNTFGNLDVYEDHVLRGCTRCQHKLRVRLPPLRKKILYLDQYFLSEAFKAKDQRFVQAALKIGELAARQLLTVPYSTVHEQETHQWVRHGEMFPFLKATSRGHQFAAAYDVERVQLEKAIDAYFRGDSSDYVVERKDALQSKVDVWESYFRIEVGRYLGDINLIRELKQQSVRGLVSLFPNWRTSQATFEQDCKAETDAAAQNYLHRFREYVVRLANGDYDALLDSPISSTVVKYLWYHVPQAVPEERQLGAIIEFLGSDHFYKVPVQDISARAFATLKLLVKEGAYQNLEKAEQRLSGFYEDIQHIATYAPYSDAFVMDRAMAELMARPTVDLQGRYNTRVFSLSNWDEFLSWLDEVEAGMSEEHKTGLNEAYPRLLRERG